MTPYVRASQEIVEAIIEGDVETVREALPTLTGHELDEHGFPLLYLAAGEGEVDIFKLLLDDEKFNPNDTGLQGTYHNDNPANLEYIKQFDALGCVEDEALEKRWHDDEVGDDRETLGAILLKRCDLAGEVDETDNTMLKILMGHPKHPFYLNPWHISELKACGEDILDITLNNPHMHYTPATIACVILNKMGEDFTKCISGRDKENLDILSETQMQHICSAIEDTDNANKMHAIIGIIHEITKKENAADWETSISRFLDECPYYNPDDISGLIHSFQERSSFHVDACKILLNKSNISLLDAQTANHLILKGAVTHDSTQMKKRPMDECDEEIIDMVWPKVDVNTLTAYPGQTSPQPEHLLIDLVSGFGGEPLISDFILYEKILQDKRLNIPSELLTRAFHLCCENYIKPPATHFACKPKHIVAAKNFDPNAMIDGTPILPWLLELCMPRILSSDRRSDNLLDVEISELVLGIINHPEFNPYHAILHDKNKTMSFSTYKLEMYTWMERIQDISNELHKHFHAPTKQSQQWLDEAFSKKIPPDELLTSDNKPSRLMTIAVALNQLPQRLKINEWAANISEATAYLDALEKFTYSETQNDLQIKRCLDDAMEAQTRINQQRSNESSHLSRYLKRQSSGQMEKE